VTNRKKPGVAFWASVVVVVGLVVYPLAYGPIGWLCERPNCPQWFARLIDCLYMPLLSLIAHAPTQIQTAWESYVHIFFVP
jgi:hypothetical protein